MRTRSRIMRLAALLLATLVAAPLAATSSAAGVDYPTGERINPGALKVGPPTRLLHVEGNTIVDGATRVGVPGANVWMLGRSGLDYLVLTSNVDYRRWRVLRASPDGTRTRVVGGRGDQPVAVLADGGRHLVLQTYTRDDRALLRVVETADGDVVRRRKFGRSVEPLDFGKRRMVLTEWGERPRQQRTFWWNPFTNRVTRIADRPGYVADVSADRVGVFLRDPYLGGCQKVTTLSAPRTGLWRSCKDRALSFSPTGKRMVTTYILSDGPGPDMVQVRARRGRVLDTYRARWFGFDVWETDRRLLLQVANARAVGVVRCTLRSCERVSKVYRTGGRDPWTAMPRWTFADESLLDR
jgi:hypothetical protein